MLAGHVDHVYRITEGSPPERGVVSPQRCFFGCPEQIQRTIVRLGSVPRQSEVVALFHTCNRRVHLFPVGFRSRQPPTFSRNPYTPNQSSQTIGPNDDLPDRVSVKEIQSVESAQFMQNSLPVVPFRRIDKSQQAYLLSRCMKLASHFEGYETAEGITRQM